MNSLSESLAEELSEQLTLAEADSGVRVVVITSAIKVFSAGGNLRNL
jgi:enoyl-CoA hydratase/carnithine racemase